MNLVRREFNGNFNVTATHRRHAHESDTFS